MRNSTGSKQYFPCKLKVYSTLARTCDFTHGFWSLMDALIYCSSVARILLTIPCSRAASLRRRGSCLSRSLTFSLRYLLSVCEL